MRKLLLLLALLLAAAPVHAQQPPRELSPAPREMVETFGTGSSDEEVARAIAAAQPHPLGSLQNPIRVGGPQQADIYLIRLRCGDGSTPQISPGTQGPTGAFGSVTQVHSVACRTGGPAKVELAFDLYHEGHIENRPPPGFMIAP
jgi:hypothetical protein